jgi:hypothetical protein
MRRNLFPFAAAVGLAGCLMATVRSEHVLTGAPRAAWAGPVRVVMEGSAAPGAYQEVAIVSATGDGSEATLPAVIGALQREAAALGCNALVRVRYDRGSSSATATGVGVWME